MIPTTLYINTIKDLRNCYDTHAKKFSSTRKKNRPELDYIAEKLSQQQAMPLVSTTAQPP